jgi:hypothetical protein
MTVLLAVICFNGACVTEPVVDSNQGEMTLAGCLGIEGMISAKQFVETHPRYHLWQLRGWKCQIGSRPARREIAS